MKSKNEDVEGHSEEEQDQEQGEAHGSEADSDNSDNENVKEEDTRFSIAVGEGTKNKEYSNHENIKDDKKKDKDKDNKKKKKSSISKSVFQEEWLAETGNFNEKLKKRGVLYVARIPPRMTPTKLKSLLSEYGEVCRVYLVEEDKSVRQRRKKQGGSGSKRYVEGWVEFAKKRIARHVALSLNNTQMGAKGSTHYGDLWNLKYLNKFKWSHLTEKVAYERRVREQKLRIEMMQARKENATYVELVETGKKLDMIEERQQLKERKRKQSNKEGGGGTGTTDNKEEEESKKKGKRQRRHQNKPMGDRSDGAAKKALLQALVQD